MIMMKKITIMGLLVALTLILIVKCSSSKEYSSSLTPANQPPCETVRVTKCFLEGKKEQYAPAHGGTTPPNKEPYDAMFFKNYGVNPFVDTDDDKFSTFAIDVDNASYTMARSYLKDGNLPPNDAIRTEEFVNFFNYKYAPPDKDAFAIHLEGAPSKFGKNYQLLRIGLKAKEISVKERKNAILTFVIDVSGSMAREDRLGLVKKSLRLLVDQLEEGDKVGIVIYGSHGQVLMEHKGAEKKDEILSAIDLLHSEGSTYAEEGIRLGYELADKAYQTNRINRIILCSDGVANVGQTGAESIFEVIKKYTDKGVFLSAIGFGMGNYNDVLLEKLGDKGNGHYAYVDNIMEARRVFVENLTGTLQVVAKDVKIQVEFNPAVVRSYRLLGYENRDVADDKFRDDKEDGGEVGAGQSVTALYEIKLWEEKTGSAATLFIRYKNPDNNEVTEVSMEIKTSDFKASFDATSDNFRLAATAAEFAEILRKSYWAKDGNLDDVLQLSQTLSAKFNNNPDVIELVDLIAKAKTLNLATSGK